MNYQVQIAIDIMDFVGHPDEISRVLNISPTYARLKDALNEHGVKNRRSVWCLRSKAATVDADVDAHWDSIEKTLLDRKEIIKKLSNNCVVDITIIVQPGERFPALSIPVSLSYFAGFVGATIDIDVY